MLYKTYTKAIQDGDLELTFNIFRENLKLFCDEARAIFYDYETNTLLFNEKEGSRLSLQFNQLWIDFVKHHSLPLEVEYEYVDKEGGNGTLKLNQILGYEYVQSKNIKHYVKVLVEFSVYIIYKNNGARFLADRAIHQCLSIIPSVVDISNMRVNPDEVASVVKSLVKNVLSSDADIAKPSATLYRGKLYEKTLSSSGKVGVYRQEQLTEFLKDYFKEHKKSTRGDIKKYLILRCAESNDSRLKLFSKSISSKTLNKVLDGFSNLVIRKNKCANDMKNQDQTNNQVLTSPNGKMNLLEMYEHLSDNEKKILKSKLNE